MYNNTAGRYSDQDASKTSICTPTPAVKDSGDLTRVFNSLVEYNGRMSDQLNAAESALSALSSIAFEEYNRKNEAKGDCTPEPYAIIDKIKCEVEKLYGHSYRMGTINEILRTFI